MKIKLTISLALAILAFIFITQNTDVVMVNFLAWSVEMSLVLLVFILLGTGIIIGWLLSSYLRFVRNRKRVKAQEAPEMHTKSQTDALEVREEADVAVTSEKHPHE